jgi:hypothetical protein
MAGALREAGDNARSEEWLRRALQIAGPLAQAHPTVLEYQYTLVSLQLARAASLEALHQNTEVEKVFGEINAVMEKLIRQQGANVRCLFVQADVHGMQAAFYLSLGNVASAGNHFQLALAAWEKLVQASFPNAQFLFGAAKSSMDFGGFCAEKTRQPEKAEAAFRRSNELMEAAVKVEPGNWELKAFWSASLLRSGLFLVSAGKAKEAAAPTEKAVALLGELRLERPNEISLLQSQAIAYAVWRKVCQANQRPDDAKVAEQNAIATLNLWIKGLKDTVSAPEDAWPQDFKETMAGAYAFRAAQLESLDRAGEAIADWDRAMRLGPEGERGKFRRSRAAALAAAGKHREAAGELEELEKADRATGEDWYQLAIGYARAFDAAGRDSTLSKEEQDKTKNNYGSHAVNALARARKEGLFKVPQQVERVKADATFAGLKSRGDFRKLVDEIGEASK